MGAFLSLFVDPQGQGWDMKECPFPNRTCQPDEYVVPEDGHRFWAPMTALLVLLTISAMFKGAAAIWGAAAGSAAMPRGKKCLFFCCDHKNDVPQEIQVA